MSNFVKHFHKDNIILVYRAFSNGLVDYYQEFLGNNATQDEAKQVVDSFFETTGVHHYEIVDAVAAEIHRYINYYCVEPKDGVDEYKLIYFMGMRLAAFMARDGHEVTSKVVKFATVVMLDERIKKYTSSRGRPELRARLVRLIKDGKLEEKLGTDGMYLIYKCSSNMLKGKKDGIEQ